MSTADSREPRVDLVIPYSSPTTITLTVVDEDGDPADLTSRPLTSTIVELGPGGTSHELDVDTADAGDGIVVIAIPLELAQSLRTAGRYRPLSWSIDEPALARWMSGTVVIEDLGAPGSGDRDLELALGEVGLTVTLNPQTGPTASLVTLIEATATAAAAAAVVGLASTAYVTAAITAHNGSSSAHADLRALIAAIDPDLVTTPVFIPGVGPLFCAVDEIDGTGTVISVLIPSAGAPIDDWIPAGWIARITVPLAALASFVPLLGPDPIAVIPGGPFFGAYGLSVDPEEPDVVIFTELERKLGTWTVADVPLWETTSFPVAAVRAPGQYRTLVPELPAFRAAPERGRLEATATASPAMRIRWPEGGNRDEHAFQTPNVGGLELGIEVAYDLTIHPRSTLPSSSYYGEFFSITKPAIESSGGDLIEHAYMGTDGSDLTIPPDRLALFTELQPLGAPGEVPHWIDLGWRYYERIRFLIVEDIAHGERRVYEPAVTLVDYEDTFGRQWRLAATFLIDPSVSTSSDPWWLGLNARIDVYGFDIVRGDGTVLANIDEATLAANVGSSSFVDAAGTPWSSVSSSIVASAGLYNADGTVFDPAEPSHWQTPPTRSSEALNELAARLDAIGA